MSAQPLKAGRAGGGSDPTSGTERGWLGEAIALAVANTAVGGGPFGALVVRGDQILGRGVNRVTTDCDPIAHAEVMAIRAACAGLGDFKLTGATLVSSCEPCPMCLAAALWARVGRIVFAADRHAAAEVGFDDREFYDLMDSPREYWPLPVVRLEHRNSARPFEAWAGALERVDY